MVWFSWVFKYTWKLIFKLCMISLHWDKLVLNFTLQKLHCKTAFKSFRLVVWDFKLIGGGYKMCKEFISDLHSGWSVDVPFNTQFIASPVKVIKSLLLLFSKKTSKRGVLGSDYLKVWALKGFFLGICLKFLDGDLIKIKTLLCEPWMSPLTRHSNTVQTDIHVEVVSSTTLLHWLQLL